MRGMHAARWPCFRSPPTRTASGLTLLEVLVVFVLASLVGTLLVQGTGFFLGQYDSVKRIGREASSDAMQQRWFASTVHAMVPYLAEDRRFVGDSEFFQGVTVQPLRVRSGIPVAARWSIVPGEEGTAVLYAEQPSPCPSDARGDNRTAPRAPRSVERDTHPASAVKGLADVACGAGTTPFEDTHWTVLESADALAFEYAGLDRVWRDHWPVEGAAREWIPRQVRLVTSAGQTVLTASFGLHQEPVVNPRDFR